MQPKYRTQFVRGVDYFGTLLIASWLCSGVFAQSNAVQKKFSDDRKIYFSEETERWPSSLFNNESIKSTLASADANDDGDDDDDSQEAGPAAGSLSIISRGHFSALDDPPHFRLAGLLALVALLLSGRARARARGMRERGPDNRNKTTSAPAQGKKSA